MSFAQAMIRSHPQPVIANDALLTCIRACFDCAQACTACADACLGETDPKSLARCIRLDLDCADLCDATGRIVSRQTAFERHMVTAGLQACAISCRLCGDECERHAAHGMEHCRVCADACRTCEQACRALVDQLAA
jgi:hypothetical protein